jgi:hypothetical protein
MKTLLTVPGVRASARQQLRAAVGPNPGNAGPETVADPERAVAEHSTRDRPHYDRARIARGGRSGWKQQADEKTTTLPNAPMNMIATAQVECVR